MYDDDSDDNRAWDPIQLQNKVIEPDSKLSRERISRNLQLGYVNNFKQLMFINNRIEFADILCNFSIDEGGWLLKEYGMQMFQTLDKQIVLSNSLNGFGRKSLNTQRKEMDYAERNIKKTLTDWVKPRNGR